MCDAIRVLLSSTTKGNAEVELVKVDLWSKDRVVVVYESARGDYSTETWDGQIYNANRHFFFRPFSLSSVNSVVLKVKTSSVFVAVIDTLNKLGHVAFVWRGEIQNSNTHKNPRARINFYTTIHIRTTPAF